MKFLVVSFDGLRPDLIGAELTPNIVRLQKTGVTLSSHRTVYPSETRVAFPSLVTGATLNSHGMVGNKFIDRKSVPESYLDTSDADLLARLNRESGGRLMSAPTLGELLSGSGKNLAVLATNSPGTTHLFHHKAEDFNHIRLSGHFREACTPADVLAEIEAEFGALPPAPAEGDPDFAGQEWITSVFLGHIWPKQRPDVTILSYGEPDTTSHFHGTGSATTREIIAYCDAQFGRVLDWWEAEGRDAGVQIFILSDHGHITAHSRVSVVDQMKAEGFKPGVAPDIDVDVVVVPGQVGALYLKNRTITQLRRLVEMLTEQPWCGSIFTAPKNGVEGIAPGSFATSLICADHERAPDVYFTFRADDTIDAFGMVGGTWYDSHQRPGLGVHGGLHPKELAAVGIAAGSAFKSDHVSTVPSGICDITPTILHLLGMQIPASMNGRRLNEVLIEGGDAPVVGGPQIFEVGLNNYSQRLKRSSVGDAIYLDEAEVFNATETAMPQVKEIA